MSGEKINIKRKNIYNKKGNIKRSMKREILKEDGSSGIHKYLKRILKVAVGK